MKKVKVWGCISYDNLGILRPYEDAMTSETYVNILSDELRDTYP